MKTTIVDRIPLVLLVTGFILASTCLIGTNAVAQQMQPTFAAHLPSNQVHVYSWPVGATLILTIDDPGIPGTSDFAGTLVVPDNSEIYGGTWAIIELSGFQLRPGQLMTITDGTTIKTHVVKTVTVTSVDPENDIISGTAKPNSGVGINAHIIPGGPVVRRFFNADAYGNWTIDLSIAGPSPDESETYDIVADSWGTASQGDDDGDNTYYSWNGSDADGDGIMNYVDNCPNENAFGYDADENGCIDTAAGLAMLIENMPTGAVAPNIKRALLAHVTSAIRMLDKGHAVAAINHLNAFVNLVEAQRDKRISEMAAGLLIDYATNVIAGAQ